MLPLNTLFRLLKSRLTKVFCLSIFFISIFFILDTSHIAYGGVREGGNDERGAGTSSISPPPPQSSTSQLIFPTDAPGYLEFSFNGPILGRVCSQIYEPAEPSDHNWADNFICAPVDIGLRFSYAGPIPGMKCTSMNEAADPHTWGDNYICVPPSSPIDFHWSTNGLSPNQRCLQITEPSDPDTWNDNYLCYVLDASFVIGSSSDAVSAIVGGVDFAKINWAKVVQATLSGGASGGAFGGILGAAPLKITFLIIGAGSGAIGEIKAQGESMSAGSSSNPERDSINFERDPIGIRRREVEVTGGGDGFTVNGK